MIRNLTFSIISLMVVANMVRPSGICRATLLYPSRLILQIVWIFKKYKIIPITDTVIFTYRLSLDIWISWVSKSCRPLQTFPIFFVFSLHYCGAPPLSDYCGWQFNYWYFHVYYCCIMFFVYCKYKAQAQTQVSNWCKSQIFLVKP